MRGESIKLLSNYYIIVTLSYYYFITILSSFFIFLLYQVFLRTNEFASIELYIIVQIESCSKAFPVSLSGGNRVFR